MALFSIFICALIFSSAILQPLEAGMPLKKHPKTMLYKLTPSAPLAAQTAVTFVGFLKNHGTAK
jgi:hypothetical protein